MTDFPTLQEFDPETAAALEAGTNDWPHPPAPGLMDALAGDILDALAHEAAFGRAVARAYVRIAREGSPDILDRYRQCLLPFAAHGPTLGRIMADALVPVALTNDAVFVDAFLSVAAIMRKKGTHTLADPMDALCRLLQNQEYSAARAFLALLAATYTRSLTFNRANLLTKTLPRSVMRLRPGVRAWQIDRLAAAMRRDDRLAEALWESLLATDLGLLSRAGLTEFMAAAERRFADDEEKGLDFVGLRTLAGRAACDRLRTAVTLTEVQRALAAYAALRLGRGCAVHPVSAPSGGVDQHAHTLVHSDGRGLYLAGVLDIYPDAHGNRELYRGLVRLECSVVEGRTHDFDMDKAADRLGYPRPGREADDRRSDLAIWLGRYADPSLARYLFSLFEYARLHRWAAERYPGLVRCAAPHLRAAVSRIRRERRRHPLAPLVIWSALPDGLSPDDDMAPAVRAAVDRFAASFRPDGSVEDTALILEAAYAPLADLAADPLPDPVFGRYIDPDGPGTTPAGVRRHARRIQDLLARRGVPVYRSELIHRYREDGDAFTPEGVQRAVDASTAIAGAAPTPAPSLENLRSTLTACLVDDRPAAVVETADGPFYWYPEWDSRQGDYRSDHSRVRIGEPRAADPASCKTVLRRQHHLVTRIRRAFELLRPQGLLLLRRWMEGDDFDYRALLDFAVDRRIGRVPSQRVYLKRLKEHRDVATLLLVDQSRSTSHPAAGNRQRVMDIEKAAIVLFCEALGVLGDRFAVAGFSGSGRLGVDFYWIKTFTDAMGGAVWSRIAGMAPLRSTRMGAAIRHATAAFESVPAAVKLLIILGDGFPNDVDYKKGYAIEDTRKAVQEAHARHVHTHGITVNIASEAGLDALYGGSAHTVISDVRDLPDDLWRVYANLTRR
jgi:nitric oxide reductase NorD protein